MGVRALLRMNLVTSYPQRTLTFTKDITDRFGNKDSIPFTEQTRTKP